jgi:3-keto-L-gulonate-6-phosphate decarboxylase
MQVGYVLCSPDLLKVLCLKKGGKGVEMIEVDSTADINKCICLSDLTEIKNVYKRLQEKNLVGSLDIVNVARLYKQFY